MKTVRRSRLTVFILISLCLLLAGGAAISAPAPPTALPEVYRQIAALSEQEKATLAELFALSDALQRSEAELSRLQQDQIKLQKDVRQAKQAWQKAQNTYLSTRDHATQALRVLQRLGPVSYLEVLVGSSTLKDLWHRLNLLSAAVGGINRNLYRLQADRDRMAEQKEALLAKQDKLAQIVAETAAQVAEIKDLMADKEAVLAGLGSRRAYFEQKLAEIETLWVQEIKPFLVSAGQEFSRLLSDDSQDVSGVSLKLTDQGLALTVPWQEINSRLLKSPILRGTSLAMDGEQVKMEIPDHSLILRGQFVVDQGVAVRYQVEQVLLAGIAVSEEAVAELAKDQPIKADFSAALRGYHIRGIAAEPENLVLYIGSSTSREGGPK